MSVGNSQKEEKRKRRPTQFQNPKFGDFFFPRGLFYPREISSLRGIGVPTRSPFLFAGEEKGASIGKRDRATDASERAPWFSALSPVGTAANRRLLFLEGERHPLERCKSVCSKWPQKRCRRVLCTREGWVSWDRGPVEDDEVRSKTSIDRGGNL